MNRRSFIKSAVALPLFGIGGVAFGQSRARQIAKGAQMRVAVIGCGARVHSILEPILRERVVALVDPDPAQLARVRALGKKLPNGANMEGARAFADYRELFDKMGDSLDAVFIATPNHHHALATVLAAPRGIHVFVEKPMAHTLEEARAMGAAAKASGIVTQVGNFGHSTKAMRVCVESIKRGLIGEIREVWCYDDRVNAMRYRPPSAKPPAGMDWDLWCGGSPVCDYYGPTEDHNGLHPHDWHSWIDYGNGSIGNMATHIMDAAFWSLDLGSVHPLSVETQDVQFACDGAWAWRDTLEYRFPARGDLPPVTLHWYDGLRDGIPFDKAHIGKNGHPVKRAYLNLPPVIAKYEREFHLEKAPFAPMGTIFEGTKGVIWFSHHSMIRFFPKHLGKEMKKFPGYKSTEHVHEFYNAIVERREANTNFGFSVPLAETLLLGNVAARAGKGKLLWDGTRITNNPAANAFLSAPVRSGWSLPSA